MDKIDFISRNDLESIGKYYFEKASNFVLVREFGKSYEFFKEGLDYITCDCGGKWAENVSNQVTNIFVDIENSDSDHMGYFFSKALLYSYFKDKKKLYLGLDAIDKYLKINKDEYGLYIKGKILAKLEDYNEAINSFNLSANLYGMNSRLNYRIGRTKEQHLNEYGLNYLLAALIDNPSSACCARVLYSNLKKRDNLQMFKDISADNSLLIIFQNIVSEDEFQKQYEMTINLNPHNISHNSFNTMIEFVDILKSISTSLLNQNDHIEKKRSSNFFNESNSHDSNRDVFDAYSDESYDEWNERGGDIWNLRESMGY